MVSTILPSSLHLLFMFTVLLTECGKTFTCGLGSAGQLGHGGTKNLSSVRHIVI